MKEQNLSYKNVGVDINRTDKLKQDMVELLETPDNRVLNKLGAFASLYDLGNMDIKEPVLVLKAEEPGSKQKLAFDFGYEASICHDMINHLVNDIIVMGAKPLAVLDVIISGGINEEIIKTLVKETAIACQNNECSLVGGETSIQPGIVDANLCVLSSSIIGIADKKDVIDGNKIEEGDCILAIASNGLHTNGYTMIRKMIAMDCSIINDVIEGAETFLEGVMKPHTAYYPYIKDIMSFAGINGMAHITGGGIEGNLSRILPEHLSAHIDLSQICTLPIFKYIKNFGDIDDSEMLSTFNCGVGYILVVSSLVVDEIQNIINQDIPCYKIGAIEKKANDKTIVFRNSLNW